MRSIVARGVNGVARGTKSIVSQVIASVITALCVAYITNAYLGDRSASEDPEPTQVAVSESVAPPVPKPLPPLEIEVIADLPSPPEPAQEIFPGVPAGVSPDALQQTVAAEKKRERRRFLGIPLPFTTADSTGSASEATEVFARGG